MNDDLKDPNRAVDYVIANAGKFAAAKAQRVYLEEFRKSKKAILMGQSAATTPGRKNANGSVFQQSAAGLQNAGKATLAAGKGFGSVFANPYGAVKPSETGYNAATQNNPALIKSAVRV